MRFVKTHWILLASGVVAVIAIVFTVLGMTSDSVIQEMEKRKQAAAEINTLRNDAQNEETINAEKERGRQFEQEFEAVMQTAERINERRPLMDGVFPRPADIPSQYRFQESYRKTVWNLPSELKAGDLPGDQEISDEAEIAIEQDRRKKLEAGEDVTAPTPTPTPGRTGQPPPPPTPPPTGTRGRGGAPTGRGRGGGGGPPEGAAPGQASGAVPQGLPPNVSPEEVRRRADIKKARAIRIYASPATSFHISPIAQSDEAPSPRDMWYAQVGLWVQEDLVKAIADVNEAAAQQTDEKDTNVGNMPVKRIESIRVWGYVTTNGELVPFPNATMQPGGTGDKAGALGLTPSFTTRSKSDDQFDVVRVTLAAIVDQRDILKLVDSITRANFYQLVGVEYTRAESQDPQGYLYGGEPVVHVVLDFEGYMARKIYKSLMPVEVQQDLGIVPAPEVKAP